MTATATPTTLCCPRCGQPLTPRHVRGITVESCRACNGVLVPQLKLMGLLENLSDSLLASFDPDTHIDKIDHPIDPVACPSCRNRMEQADYCGAKLVTFERCNRCTLVWLAGDELGTMTLMWCRMEKRIARHKAENEEALSALDALNKAARLTRAVDAVIWGRFL